MLKLWLAMCILLSIDMHGWGLNDPVSSETPRAHLIKTSSDVTAYFMHHADGETICMVVDRGEYRPPIFFLLANPGGQSAVDVFLSECEKALQKINTEGEIKRIGIIESGTFFQGQVGEWYEKISTERQKLGKEIPLVFFGHPPIQILTDATSQSPQLLLSYTFRLPSPNLYRDVRKLCTLSLIQHMTLQRIMEEVMGLTHVIDPSEFLLPASNLRIALPFDEQHWQKNLHMELQKIRNISEVGFTIEELQAAKKSSLQVAQSLQKEKNGSSRSAFLAQTFLRDLSSLEYETFIDSAASLIQSITPVDIAIVLHECFSVNQRTISYLGQYSIDPSWIEQVEQVIHFFEKGKSEHSTLPQHSTSENLFENLPLNDEEKTIIYKIIDTMSRDNVVKLGWKRKSMEKKGKKVRHVHPLRFLGHIFSDPYLRQCMRDIHHSSFKWNGFIDGMRDRIEGEADRGGLLPYIPGFAKHVQANEQKIRHHIERRDWDGLVRYLL